MSSCCHIQTATVHPLQDHVPIQKVNNRPHECFHSVSIIRDFLSLNKAVIPNYQSVHKRIKIKLEILSFTPNLLKIQQIAICVLIVPSSGHIGEHTTFNDYAKNYIVTS